MIIANITSFEGQDLVAEHYYCSYRGIGNLGDKLPTKTYSGSSFEKDELYRLITEQKEANYINKKDGGRSYHIGTKTNRFQSFNQIHSKLIELFPNEDIVTYYESQLFKEMLYIKDGINLGIKGFGEVFTYTPTSCYKDLLPSPDSIIIKCEDCGKVYTLDEVTYERELFDRTLIQFIKKRDMDEVCCEYFNLTWNVVL